MLKLKTSLSPALGRVEALTRYMDASAARSIVEVGVRQRDGVVLPTTKSGEEGINVVVFFASLRHNRKKKEWASLGQAAVNITLEQECLLLCSPRRSFVAYFESVQLLTKGKRWVDTPNH